MANKKTTGSKKGAVRSVHVQRNVRPELRTFDHFPEDKECIICGTSEDDKCVLIMIDGTTEGNIAQAEPVHLACAVASNYNKQVGVIYRKTLCK